MTSRGGSQAYQDGDRDTGLHSQAEWKALALETGFYTDLTFEALLDRLERAVSAR